MLGATARYSVARAIPAATGHFPWATFWTNLSGSFVLGFALILFLERFPPTRYLRAFFAVGVVGAYTTFSTFVVDADLLLKDGHYATAALYVTGSLFGGLLAAWAGMSLARFAP